MKKQLLTGFIFFTAAAFLALPLAAGELTPTQERVRKALVTLPYYSVFDNLKFRVEGTKAVLEGQVHRPTLKSDAEAAVSRLEEIESVENNIEVLPVSPNDDRIRELTFRAIYGNPTFTRYAIRSVPPIHIIVKNGDVTLEGVVASESDKNYAGILANGVFGAFSVTNNLVVEGS